MARCCIRGCSARRDETCGHPGKTSAGISRSALIGRWWIPVSIIHQSGSTGALALRQQGAAIMPAPFADRAGRLEALLKIEEDRGIVGSFASFILLSVKF
jgi:hypothetical protein